ncbi:ketosteroid isomerase [Natronomonas sp. CBA1123]|uniref:nuclear transport factor 2 family protein n=1 Tax=Natronomonas sp. CBA1123 TaxID=2668070 RepID=UPI0012EAD2C9|nr:nuclear transport factor 2 family protein [Natronomonas sp. CBA1123]MUV85725.1 ketosteroid isomerase [Natronomonas sp. CBA1123]
MDGPALAREYYRSIDADDYETLTSLLAADFVHERPDRTLSGRERFVEFMREERPETDTEHAIDAVYSTDAGGRVAIEGRLLRADGEVWFGFVDTFDIDGEVIADLRTYTDEHPL